MGDVPVTEATTTEAMRRMLSVSVPVSVDVRITKALSRKASGVLARVAAAGSLDDDLEEVRMFFESVSRVFQLRDELSRLEHALRNAR